MGNNFSPIVASRNYLYAAVAGNEVMAAGNAGKYKSLAGQLRGLPPMPQPAPGNHIDFELASPPRVLQTGGSCNFSRRQHEGLHR